MFRLTIDTANAAFEDDKHSLDGAGLHELARILREIADKLERGHTDGTARDINGNTVGKFTCSARR